MFRLMPRDEGFFDLFEHLAATIVDGARLLDEFMTSYSDIQNRASQIHNIEHSGDHLTREAIEKLNRTFITPFDREAIHELVGKLDDVLDRIDEAADRMVIYRIREPTEDARALAKILLRSAIAIQETLPLLRNMKERQVILNKCLDIHTLESEGDRIERHALGALFEGRMEPVDIIKWKDIYQDLEEASDRCADVANVIESIVIRHS
jgi:predicted phosphate transport protein (TIGR00153 family)